MSLNAFTRITSDLATTDLGKVGILAGCVALLFALARWASRLGESSAAEVPPDPLLATVVPINSRRDHYFPAFPAESSLGSWQITNMYFTKYDLLPGPPDPESFNDELFVDLYDTVTGYKWTQSFYVASPKGLEQLLEEKSWTYAYADSVFVFDHYDLHELRRAVVDHLAGMREMPRQENNQDNLL
ncbi:MAG TPA: hypothetical protein VEG30_09490 [Terriglobales bacterium]|nr:hypothetical protein [Terriglobales bacterium]